MPLIIDGKLLDIKKMGLETIGQALAHLRLNGRLVTCLHIDGSEPELKRFRAIRKFAIGEHDIEIRTADPRQMARLVLDEVEQELSEARRLTRESSSLLMKNQVASAVEKLGGLLTTWRHVQDSLVKTAQILRLDPERIKVRGKALTELLHDFAGQVQQIRRAVRGRDFNVLADLLAHKLALACEQCRDAVGSVRKAAIA